jgi:hypothetical protein
VELVVFLKPVGVKELFDSALGGCDEDITRWSAPLEKAWEEIVHWTETVGMGRVLSRFGNQVCLKVPSDKMDDLTQFVKKYENSAHTILAVGIGVNTSEAYKAVCASEDDGGSRIVLYSPEIEEESITKADDFDNTHSGHQFDNTFEFCFPGLDLEKDDEQQMQQDPAPEQQEQPQQKEGNPAKERLIQTLMLLKEKAPIIAQLKEVDPQAYEAVKKLTEAVLALAQGMNKQEASLKKEHKDADVVGTESDGRVKVEAHDPVSGEKTGNHWHNLVGGMMQKPDDSGGYHPISPRKPLSE